jgi:hypothetical protein
MKIKFLSIIFLCFLIPNISLASEIYFSANEKDFSLGGDYMIDVYLDTEGKSINAIEGDIIFPSNLLDFKSFRDGNSAINFWIQKPNIVNDGKLSFSGITTGGFSGTKNFLFSLIFHTKNIGMGDISFDNLQILSNDGLGTVVNTFTPPFAFSILKDSISPNNSLDIIDRNPPESFIPVITQDKDIFDGKSFLVFSTVDKGSGIDHYEVLEDRYFFWDKYVVAESPYLLKNSKWTHSIYVKAFDKAQNYRWEKLSTQNEIFSLKYLGLFGIILVICIYFLRKIYLKFF